MTRVYHLKNRRTNNECIYTEYLTVDMFRMKPSFTFTMFTVSQNSSLCTLFHLIQFLSNKQKRVSQFYSIFPHF